VVLQPPGRIGRARSLCAIGEYGNRRSRANGRIGPLADVTQLRTLTQGERVPAVCFGVDTGGRPLGECRPPARNKVARDMAMKQIIAIVRPFVAEKVLDALDHAPLEACLVHEVKGYGRQKSYLDAYRGSEYSMAFLPKVQIIVWVADLRAEEVVQTIVSHARTGRMGDGKVFVLSATHLPEQAIDLGTQTSTKAEPAE